MLLEDREMEAAGVERADRDDPAASTYLPPGAVAAPVGRDREPRGPRLRRYEVPVPGLDPAHDGVRIAHLSDLHVGLLTPERRIQRAIELANDAGADLTVLTGDYVCYSPKFVGRMGELFRPLRGPVVATLGNHDYWTDGEGVVRELVHDGHDVLRNQFTTLRLRGVPFHVIGVDDALTGHADVAHAFRGLPRTGSRLTLTHIPDMADPIAEHTGGSTPGHRPQGSGGLILAGHTHGGHVHIPRVTPRIMQRFGLRYLAGFYPVGSSLLYVNRGIGSSSVPIRAGAPAEVAILTLRVG